MKVRLKLINGSSCVVDMDKNTQLTPHFKLWELANNQGKTSEPQFELSSEVFLFLNMIEELRKWYNKPMTCNSCFRQPAFNKSAGGSSNSLHLKALAFDWSFPNMTNQQRTNVTNKWKELCTKYGRIGGINYYTWGVHIDAYEDLFGARTFVMRDYR